MAVINWTFFISIQYKYDIWFNKYSGYCFASFFFVATVSLLIGTLTLYLIMRNKFEDRKEER